MDYMKTITRGTWAMMGQSALVCLWHLIRKRGEQKNISKDCKEVRFRISWGSNVKLGQLQILRNCSDLRLVIQGRESSPSQLSISSFWREMRFHSYSFGRDSKWLTFLTTKIVIEREESSMKRRRKRLMWLLLPFSLSFPFPAPIPSN